MLYHIADLSVSIPPDGGMDARCEAYLSHTDPEPDIVLRTDQYRFSLYPNWPADIVSYMESGFLFYLALLNYDGLMLHASAVELDGKAYLFSADPGVGKSTHTRLWQQVFGQAAVVFNDDKPALRRLEDRWYAYGTPWCGKDGINRNRKVPLAGICFLRQGQENRIRRLSPLEAIQLCLPQTLRRFREKSNTLLLMDHLDKLIREIPIFELENRPEPEAVRLSHSTMVRAAEEAGL